MPKHHPAMIPGMDRFALGLMRLARQRMSREQFLAYMEQVDALMVATFRDIAGDDCGLFPVSDEET